MVTENDIMLRGKRQEETILEREREYDLFEIIIGMKDWTEVCDLVSVTKASFHVLSFPSK